MYINTYIHTTLCIVTKYTQQFTSAMPFIQFPFPHTHIHTYLAPITYIQLSGVYNYITCLKAKCEQKSSADHYNAEQTVTYLLSIIVIVSPTYCDGYFCCCNKSRAHHMTYTAWCTVLHVACVDTENTSPQYPTHF